MKTYSLYYAIPDSTELTFKGTLRITQATRNAIIEELNDPSLCGKYLTYEVTSDLEVK